jgi:hypothetical protein
MDDEEITVDDEFLEDEFLSIPDINEIHFRWTTKRREFVINYARSGNASESAISAGFHPDTGAELIKFQPIRDAIQKEIARQLVVIEETPTSVLARWAVWANADICEIFDDNWNIKTLDQIPVNQRKCIKKVKVTQNAHGRNTEIEMFDAHKANNDLALSMGLLNTNDPDNANPEDSARRIQEALKQIRLLNADSPIQTTEPGPEGKKPNGNRTIN